MVLVCNIAGINTTYTFIALQGVRVPLDTAGKATKLIKPGIMIAKCAGVLVTVPGGMKVFLVHEERLVGVWAPVNREPSGTTISINTT